MSTASFGVTRSPRLILFGHGQRFALGRTAVALGRRALLCTDPRFGAAPELGALVDNLREAGVEARVYDGTEAELPAAGIHACVDAMRGFDPEVVVGVGGGSCMDMAKLVSLLLAHDGPLDRYYGELNVPGPVRPVIALPTTSGTGSEVTPVAVLADDARDLKVGVSTPYLIPHAAICDPDLTTSCPPRLTAYSAADALTHAIESFTAVRREPTAALAGERVFVGKNALSDAYALSAIGAIARWLPRALADGADGQARAGLMLGALHAGLAFGAAGTAAAHAIQYPVGALTHTAHAVGVAQLMPYVMAYNRPACTDEFAQIARAMNVAGDDPERLADAAIDAVAALLDGAGVPRTLAELGLPQDRIGWVAAQSMLAARLVTNNPRPLDERTMHAIVAAAFRGDRAWRG
ncbi:iron-containing alcohol dehydrogenase [Pigmentiphaga soli]|uniref:Iron-containing alcohol dehydrogenase n=1 Tax=Pigmentiphaga soli TaxID=1007095 RepID=A0ABP8GB85_9BURK